nr:MAG TPA: hypothetical protein [Caudoviricetes sp.]
MNFTNKNNSNQVKKNNQILYIAFVKEKKELANT